MSEVNDEPQFSVVEPEQNKAENVTEQSETKKPKSSKPLIVMFCVLGVALGLLGFQDELIALANKDKELKDVSVSTERVNDLQTSPFFTPDDNSATGNEIKLTQTENPIVTQPERGVTAVPNDVNAALFDKLADIQEQLKNLEEQVMLSQNVVEGRVASNRELLVNAEKAINTVYQTIMDDSKSEKQRFEYLKNGINKFNNYSTNVKEQAEKLNFDILHVEVWAGKKRLIGYESSSPNQVLKLNIGNKIGQWTLTEINDEKAIFVFWDGSKREVSLP